MACLKASQWRIQSVPKGLALAVATLRYWIQVRLLPLYVLPFLALFLLLCLFCGLYFVETLFLLRLYFVFAE